jgi:hypothetical protein
MASLTTARLVVGLVCLSTGCRVVERTKPVFQRGVGAGREPVLLQTKTALDVTEIEWLGPLAFLNPKDEPLFLESAGPAMLVPLPADHPNAGGQ